MDIMDRMRKQSLRFGTDILSYEPARRASRTRTFVRV